MTKCHKGDIVRIANIQGEHIDFRLDEYEPYHDAWRLSIRTGQSWDGPMPTLAYVSDEGVVRVVKRGSAQ